MNYYTLTYHFVDDYMEKRAPLRSLHFEHLKPYVDSGKLILGGAYNDTTKGALIVFRVENTTEVHDFVKDDPYYINDIVLSYEVNLWNVVLGDAF